MNVSHMEFLKLKNRNGNGLFVFILGCDIYSSTKRNGKKSSEITRVGFQVKGWEFSCNNVTGK